MADSEAEKQVSIVWKAVSEGGLPGIPQDFSAEPGQELLDGLFRRWEGARAETVRRALEAAAGEEFEGTVLEAPLTAWIGRGGLHRAHFLEWLAAAGGVSEEARTSLEVGVELVHAGSLLHDDIIDESPMRRGLPALWVSHGTKAALLAGDLLISLGIDEVGRTTGGMSGGHAAWLAARLAAAAHVTCQGELAQDFPAQGRRPDAREVAALKTGALFEWVMLASLPEDLAHRRGAADLVTRLEFARKVGVAYQMLDDARDGDTQ